MPCHQHGNVSARFSCGGCQGLWCVDCVVRPEEHNATYCPKCNGLLRAIPPTRVMTEEERFGIHVQEPQVVEGTFMGSLARAFLFPLSPMALLSLILASVMLIVLVIATLTGGFRALGLGMLLSTAFIGLLANYLGDIILSVATGDEELPQLQWFENFIMDGMFPGCRAIFLIAICFGGLPYLAFLGEPRRGVLLVLFSSFFFPIMWLGSALTRSRDGAVNPTWIRLMRVISFPYLMTYLTMVIGLSGCYALFNQLARQSDGYAFLSVIPLVMYFLYVVSFMLGKLVYHHQEEFEEVGLF